LLSSPRRYVVYLKKGIRVFINVDVENSLLDHLLKKANALYVPVFLWHVLLLHPPLQPGLECSRICEFITVFATTRPCLYPESDAFNPLRPVLFLYHKFLYYIPFASRSFNTPVSFNCVTKQLLFNICFHLT
jgi:hypothetical protein